MSADHYNEPLNVKVRSANLDLPTLVDRIGEELLDHLCACHRCSAVFAAQEHSLANAGCIVGMRMVSESRVKWAQRKAALALGHVTAETLDDYLFNRLTVEEKAAVNDHVSFCIHCANEFSGRETLITCIKAAFCETHDTDNPSPIGAVNVRFPARALGTCVVRKKCRDDL
jgi:hypothetical protein